MLRTPLSSPSIKQAIAHAKGFSLAGQPPSSPTTSNFRAQASPLSSPIVPSSIGFLAVPVASNTNILASMPGTAHNALPSSHLNAPSDKAKQLRSCLKGASSSPRPGWNQSPVPGSPRRRPTLSDTPLRLEIPQTIIVESAELVESMSRPLGLGISFEDEAPTKLKPVKERVSTPYPDKKEWL